MKKRYVMTLIWEDKTESFDFYSTEEIKDGQKDAFLDMVMMDWLDENYFDTKWTLPHDYIVDTYDNWCFMKSLEEQMEERDKFLENYEIDMFNVL